MNLGGAIFAGLLFIDTHCRGHEVEEESGGDGRRCLVDGKRRLVDGKRRLIE